MVTIYGEPASLGQGMGVLLRKEKALSTPMYCGEVKKELELFEEACKLADTQYSQMVTDAKHNFGDAVAMMVWSHQLLLQDEGFRTKIKELVQSEKISACSAIMITAKEIVKPMSISLDNYLRERQQDILYVAEWLMNCCSMISYGDQELNDCRMQEQEGHPVILIGKNFGLEDVLAGKQKGVVGMVDLEGSLESHTVMIAKELKIPMLIQLKEEIEYYVNRLASLNTVLGCVEIE